MYSRKIVVVGSSNTDMVIKSDHLPSPGETVLGGEFSMNPGGKGANQAVAAASLEGEVVFVARVGGDELGKQAIKGFKHHGIDTRFVSIDQSVPTGVALILVDDKGENSISVALGANATLKKSHIEPALTEIQNSAYVLTQLESPVEVTDYLAEIAKQHELRLVLNPAPARKLSDEILNALHIITPNEIEAGLLSGVPVTDENSAKSAALVLYEKGVDIVIITLGDKGAYVLSEEMDELIPAQKVDVVDTTAAGDTFNGALLVALTEGKNLRSAIQFAHAAAAYSVGVLGAQTSAPSRKDLEM